MSSSSSTPAKKRKRYCSWSVIVDRIPDQHKTMDLLPLLEDMEDFSAFINYKTTAKNVLLKHMLGDDSILPSIILDIVESFIAGNVSNTIESRLECLDLSPSEYVSHDCLLQLFNAMFCKDPSICDFPCMSISQCVAKHVDIKYTKFDDEAATQMELPSCLSMFEILDKHVIINNEFSLHGKLSIFVSCVAYLLEKKVGDKFSVEFEYRFVPGRKYAVDGAVICKKLNRQPIIMFELKQQVASKLIDQSHDDLREFFVQSFYLSQVSYEYWHCLTDLNDFHYMKFQTGHKHLLVDECQYTSSDLADLESFSRHMTGIMNLLYKQ